MEQTQKKANERWTDDEVQTFLSIYADEEIQRELESATRNDKVYAKISGKLSDLNIVHTGRQCREKLKKLKQDYKKIKDHNNKSGSDRRTSKWFDRLDALLGHRPSSGAARTKDEDVTRAELCFTGFTVEHNLPIAASDHAGPLFRKMFPDSKIAMKYGCARTKTSAIEGPDSINAQEGRSIKRSRSEQTDYATVLILKSDEVPTISSSPASCPRDKQVIADTTDHISTITVKTEDLQLPLGPEDEANAACTQCKMESDLTEMKIGFIGAGNMAFGIAQGILMSGKVNPENVKVSAPSSNNLGRFQELGVAVTHSNSEVVTGSRLVFMAVKPHLVPTVLCEIAPLVTQQHVIVSVAAGITLATLEGLLPPDSVVMRLMPNLPCMVQEGALLFSRGSRARPEDGSLLRGLLTPCGLVEEGPETWIDAHTGLSGSGVAFVYLFAEALAEGGVKMGMPSALAHRIAAQTVLGAGRLLRDSGKHPAQLRSDVCTPGGTTIFGLHELERGGLRATTMGAVEAATERARELGKK
ncbi:hypothetical protein AAFF_G00124310 [Aldrovandia affinis]|uniref:Pyrroline-5-carboxylate reductase n=1 Tax=Aldrovandia affinis TaxID=143900 RepID=A0AAD7RRI0_9TELE|nr:hypothetical protein AAFF_G00124310 [Aldrovandia affinis]